MITFPSVDEALELHRLLIIRFGGSGGVRDLGLLESALFRPQTGYYADIVQMAAALMESLIINHPFVDGNKRVAFFMTDVFLRMNGWKIQTPSHAGHQFMIQVITSDAPRFQQIQTWLKNNLVEL